jgi:hypothetical protein
MGSRIIHIIFNKVYWCNVPFQIAMCPNLEPRLQQLINYNMILRLIHLKSQGTSANLLINLLIYSPNETKNEEHWQKFTVYSIQYVKSFTQFSSVQDLQLVFLPEQNSKNHA